MALAQHYVPVKKLSALAQLVAIHAERGTTSTKELSRITGYSARAVRMAKAEARCRKPAADYQEARYRSEASPPLAKKKGSPHTPLKEKTQPLPSGLADRESNPISVGASSKEQPAKNSNWGKQESPPRRANPADQNPRQLTAEQEAKLLQQAGSESWGRKITNPALVELRRRMALGEVRSPPAIFGLICRDLAAKRQAAIASAPYGALILDDGTIVSRW